MAERIMWDKYEAAILLEAVLKIENNSESKGNAIERVSRQLRSMAQNRGLSIDDTYRNANGIEKAINFAATKLAMRECKSFVITSDHGASRLAVIKRKEEKYSTETGGEHSGRCCKVFNGCDLTNCVEEKGYFVLTDYGRFKGSRAANVEVHGGASLEEVLVPIITLTLKKQDDVDIRVLNSDNILADRKKGTTVQIYISDVDNPNNISLVIGSTKYKAVRDDSTHYTAHLEDIKRSKICKADIYDGDNLLGNVEFKIKGKSGSVDSGFDSEFDDF